MQPSSPPPATSTPSPSGVVAELLERASRRHVLTVRHHDVGWGTNGVSGAISARIGGGKLLMLGVGRGEWRTLRPTSGVSGPHRLRRTLAPQPSSASLLPSATRPSTFAPSSTSQADEFQATRQTDPIRRQKTRERQDLARRKTRPRATPCSRLYRPGEERVCKFADQNAIGGGATPPLGQPLVGQKGGVSLF